MFCKKSLLIAAASFCVVANQSNAEEAHYVGLDLSLNQLDYKSNIASAQSFDDDAVGVGIRYGYRFDLASNMFITPELFFDYMGSSAKDSDSDPTEIDYKYGIKANLGYDISDDWSGYVSFGVDQIDYSVKWNSVSREKSSHEFGFIWGVGASKNLSDSTKLDLSFHRTNVDFDGPIASGLTPSDYEVDIDVLKIGLSYKF